MNKEEVFLSVLIPVYNVQSYLNDCIDSVLAQTTELRYEIVLVDDGSTDSSGQICDKYEIEFPDKVTVVHKKNGGLISARRAALKEARGKYIVWLDSDDTFSDGYFNEIKRIHDSFNSDIVIFNFNKINEKGLRLNRKQKYIFDEGSVKKDEIYKKAIGGTSVNQLCKKVCKRELYDIDKDYSEYYKIQNGEDLIQSVHLFEVAGSFYYSQKAFYNYRINPNSLSRKVKPDQYKSLDVLRPMLYESMVKAGYGSDENTNIFFSYYLKTIWETITDYVAASEEKDNSSVFKEMFEMDYVQLAKRYMTGNHKGLKLFYEQKWDRLQSYARKICFLIYLKKKVKMLIAEIYGK